MKIFPASVIRKLDKYTIEKSGIASIDLMESAAEVFTSFFTKLYSKKKAVKIFCGTGNNGGDGLAVSRQLIQKGYKVETYILLFNNNFSDDFSENLSRLDKLGKARIIYLNDNIPLDFGKNEVIVDAIFGSGLSKSISGFTEQMIEQINQSGCNIIAIDIPSGLSCDKHLPGTKIKATYTLSFELPKLSFMLPENHQYTGNWRVKSIGLNKEFIEEHKTAYYYFTLKDVKSIIKKREKFSHKGSNGHSLIIAGKTGYYGAAVLAAKACIYAGSGLTSCHIARKGAAIVHTSVPELIVREDVNANFITKITLPEKINAIGIGPGMGKHESTSLAIHDLIKKTRIPIVADADALNILAEHKEWLSLLPKNSIITPHPKEFERLAGNWNNDYERLQMQIDFSKKHKLIVVLKGAHTSVSMPDGKVYFNSSGNAALASGGSGDVLTGIITSLIAQQYSPADAALMGVYIHGLCADIHQKNCRSERMTASQIIEQIQSAFELILAE
jgi:ADP-dependent NAD(P)H-hydrate dehydratase / NAD(P)H-hydrate epimerase